MQQSSGNLKEFFSALRAVFLGTGEFAVLPLETLITTGVQVIAVVTAPDAPAGRGEKLTPPPVKIKAVALGIPVLQPEQLDAAFLREFDAMKPDIAVLAAYGKIVPKTLLGKPKHGFLNIHPSLLPKYRGASPIQSAILDGERESGVTIIRMDEMIDHGPIVSQARLAVRRRETASGLSERLSVLGGKLLPEALARYLAERAQPIPQNHDEATFTRILTKEDGKLAFDRDAEELERAVRAFTPWPGAWCWWRSAEGIPKRVKIIEAEALPLDPIGDVYTEPGRSAAPPSFGAVMLHRGDLGIVTGHGILAVRTLQLEGKKPVSAEEFLNGNSQIVGCVLE